MTQQTIRRLKWFGPPALALVLLAGIGLQQLSYASPGDAAPYHRKVAQTMAQFPEQIGSWVGSHRPQPRAAMKMLNPNEIISRQYVHAQTNDRVMLLFSHCKEARDMRGHYPPRCYPSNGYTQQTVKDYQWTVDGMTVPVRAYRFTRDDPGRGKQQMWNLNFMMLPDGELTRSMDRLRTAAADYRMHFYGAGQVQLLFYGKTKLSYRKAVFKRFVREMKPAIQAIRSGIDHDNS